MALQEEFEKQGNFLFKYRSYFPLIFIIFGIMIYSVMEYNSVEEPETFLDTSYEIICFSVCIIGLIIRIYTVGYSSNRTSGRNTKKQVADSLNTTGIYSIVRHPLYLGNYFMWLGICMFIQSTFFVIIFSLSFWIYYERIMFAEEQFLRRKFGDFYIDWANKTAAFIPSFKNFVKPSNSFNFRKVLRKEKDGFFAFILILFFLDIIGDLIEEKRLGIDDLHWYIIFAIGLVVYLILTLLIKKKNA